MTYLRASGQSIGQSWQMLASSVMASCLARSNAASAASMRLNGKISARLNCSRSWPIPFFKHQSEPLRFLFWTMSDQRRISAAAICKSVTVTPVTSRVVCPPCGKSLDTHERVTTGSGNIFFREHTEFTGLIRGFALIGHVSTTRHSRIPAAEYQARPQCPPTTRLAGGRKLIQFASTTPGRDGGRRVSPPRFYPASAPASGFIVNRSQIHLHQSEALPQP